MDQLAQRAFVSSIAIGRVEAAQAVAAQRTAAFGIQREAIQKRRPATDAEEFRDQRLRLPQAFAANGDARYLKERLAANAAIVGKEKGKKSVGGCSDDRRTEACDCG